MPEQRVEKEDGIYELQKSELLTGKADGRSKYAETDITYQVEYIDNLPAEGTVTVRDEDTGIELQEKLPAIRTITGESYWDDNFSFPITIADYDAEAFLLGDILVPRGAALIDYADELLEQMCIRDSPYGTYYLVELKAPAGYIKMEPQKIEITADSSSVVKAVNHLKMGKVRIEKVDEKKSS